MTKAKSAEKPSAGLPPAGGAPAGRPSSHTLIKGAVLDSLACLPWVLKKTTLNFALIWLPIAAIVIALVNIAGFGGIPIHPLLADFDSGDGGLALKDGMMFSLRRFEYCFIMFIIPYFVYAFINKPEGRQTAGGRQTGAGESGSPVPEFWDFIAAGVWPLVKNHIKAFFVILVFFLLLIIPGIIKCLRLCFVTQAVFFNEGCLRQGKSALKASQDLTRGRLRAVALFTVYWLLFMTLCPLLLNSALSLLFFFGSGWLWIDIIKDSIAYGAGFYLSCFSLVLMTQFYFHMLKEKAREGALPAGQA